MRTLSSETGKRIVDIVRVPTKNVLVIIVSVGVVVSVVISVGAVVVSTSVIKQQLSHCQL